MKCDWLSNTAPMSAVQRVKLAVLTASAFISISGIPSFATVQSIKAIAGVTLTDQVQTLWKLILITSLLSLFISGPWLVASHTWSITSYVAVATMPQAS